MTDAVPSGGKRITLIVLLVGNAIACMATLPISGFAVSAGKLRILSAYRELDINGLIDRPAVQEYDDGRFSGEWTEIPNYLNELAFEYVQVVFLCMSVLFFANSCLLACVIVSFPCPNERTILEKQDNTETIRP